jgi:hypothetical protein
VIIGHDHDKDIEAKGSSGEERAEGASSSASQLEGPKRSSRSEGRDAKSAKPTPGEQLQSAQDECVRTTRQELEQPGKVKENILGKSGEFRNNGANSWGGVWPSVESVGWLRGGIRH